MRAGEVAKGLLMGEAEEENWGGRREKGSWGGQLRAIFNWCMLLCCTSASDSCRLLLICYKTIIGILCIVLIIKSENIGLRFPQEIQGNSRVMTQPKPGTGNPVPFPSSVPKQSAWHWAEGLCTCAMVAHAQEAVLPLSIAQRECQCTQREHPPLGIRPMLRGATTPCALWLVNAEVPLRSTYLWTRERRDDV